MFKKEDFKIDFDWENDYFPTLERAVSVGLIESYTDGSKLDVSLPMSDVLQQAYLNKNSKERFTVLRDVCSKPFKELERLELNYKSAFFYIVSQDDLNAAEQLTYKNGYIVQFTEPMLSKLRQGEKLYLDFQCTGLTGIFIGHDIEMAQSSCNLLTEAEAHEYQHHLAKFKQLEEQKCELSNEFGRIAYSLSNYENANYKDYSKHFKNPRNSYELTKLPFKWMPSYILQRRSLHERNQTGTKKHTVTHFKVLDAIQVGRIKRERNTSLCGAKAKYEWADTNSASHELPAFYALEVNCPECLTRLKSLLKCDDVTQNLDFKPSL